MKVYIKNARVHADKINPSEPVDILIENGIIRQIGTGIEPGDADTFIDEEGLNVSAGWMDCFANFCDPGSETRETIRTGSNAAAAGGFTDVLLIPQTNPAVDNKSQVQYILEKSKQFAVNALPIGCITKGAQGKELAEMYDMYQAGAVAFSDGYHTLQSAGILQKAFEYLIAIDGVLIQLPDDKSIGTHGLMNEGIASTRLGLQGKPSLSEELMVSRDIELARYTGAKLHITGVSTRKSLRLVEEAKSEGVKVTCSVTPYHLFFCDEDLADYNTSLKVNPPLRTARDRAALREGVRSGVIDFIASHHQPHVADNKICEFEYAKEGMENLEVVFSASVASGISEDDFIKMQTQNIRKIFNREVPEIAVGKEAKLTLYVVNQPFTFNEEAIRSKSRNNAFIGQQFSSRVLGIVNREKVSLSVPQIA